MKSAGILFTTASALGLCLAVVPGAGIAESGEGRPRVFTDGRLRPGHLETIRVKGFPGRGSTTVFFMPTAICEDSCGARAFRGGRTNASGAASFRVRVPGTFYNERERRAYFRDGERIEVNVTWESSDEEFDVASAEPEPILVRTHGSERG
jgi:hypothetical protein